MNLAVFGCDYATAGAAKLAIVDSHSFWVYGYFEEARLPHVRVSDPAEVPRAARACAREDRLDAG
ncbi:multidrug resistance efflux pump [Paraburkholderia atlantica]|uniref:Multidrug resistance efflux pump n=1 Tax=Paraburkholderia atlantica TaxID=2654982 RepID=A0A7W8Q759_PARAM|nr:multidrug resistance efflux pump [Paraburkholderia atlantica]